MRRGRQVHVIARSPKQNASERRLFLVTLASECDKATITVNYEGQRYSVPNGTGECSRGRGMQSLALAAHLLSLHQSAADLAETGTLRIIGQ